MSINKRPQLKDYEIHIKLKLSALWISVMFCYLYGDYFELYVPGKVSGLIDGNNPLNSPLWLFLASLLMVIPALMTFLALVLKPTINKWLNISLGILFTVIMVVIAVFSLTPWKIFYVFLAVVEIILTSTIVLNAFKWPRNSDSS